MRALVEAMSRVVCRQQTRDPEHHPQRRCHEEGQSRACREQAPLLSPVGRRRQESWRRRHTNDEGSLHSFLQVRF